MAHMHHGYFDESGDLERAPGVFCVSGYFLTADAAAAMSDAWTAVLEKHSIPAFHMVDCAHGTGAFATKTKDERIEIEKTLINLIKTYTLQGVSFLAHTLTFEPPEADDQDVYSHCAESVVGALRMFLQTNRIDGDIACFFESGHQSAGRAYNRLAARLAEFSASVEFADKERLPSLQAADLLAWQTTKYVKDGLSAARKPRQDFLSLMEHPHVFAYLTLKDGHKSMGVEAWPLSRRTQATAFLNIDRSGPIALLREEGENIPIIPIGRTVNWKMGGGRMAYVLFKDLIQKPLYLAFSELPLAEAAYGLLAATSVFTDEGGPPTLPVSRIEVEPYEKVNVLRITLLDGPTIAFMVPNDVLEQFRNRLTNPTDRQS
jgi:hypothetical protein